MATSADRDPSALLRENLYLKQRNAQLQSDILDISAETERLRRLHDRLHGRLHGRSAIEHADGPAGSLQYAPKGSVSPGDAEPPTISGDQTPAGDVDNVDPADEGILSELGIRRATIDYFHVSGYRYTSLQEAIAEAKRQRSDPDGSARVK